MKYWLMILLYPHCWIRTGRYVPMWDLTLNIMMDKGMKIEPIDQYTVRMGNYEIWISNFPYSFAWNYKDSKGYFNPHYHMLPSRRTAFRFKEYLSKTSNLV